MPLKIIGDVKNTKNYWSTNINDDDGEREHVTGGSETNGSGLVVYSSIDLFSYLLHFKNFKPIFQND